MAIVDSKLSNGAVAYDSVAFSISNQESTINNDSQIQDRRNQQFRKPTSGQLRPPFMPFGRLLVDVRQREDCRLGEVVAADLETDRQA